MMVVLFAIWIIVVIGVWNLIEIRISVRNCDKELKSIQGILRRDEQRKIRKS